MKEIAREEREAYWVHNNFSLVRHIYCVNYIYGRINHYLQQCKNRRYKKKNKGKKSVNMYLLQIFIFDLNLFLHLQKRMLSDTVIESIFAREVYKDFPPCSDYVYFRDYNIIANNNMQYGLYINFVMETPHK